MRTIVARILVLIAAHMTAPVAAASPAWSVRVEDDTTPSVLAAGSPVVTAQYHFWGPDWQYAWAPFESGNRVGDASSITIPFTGTVESFGLRAAGSVRDEGSNTLVWSWRINAQRNLAGIIGGGLEFALRPELLEGAATPELLDDARGWRWPVGPGQEVRVEFDRSLAELYFERGDTSRIRCLFVGRSLDAGAHAVTMRLTLPEGGVRAPAARERAGAFDPRTWHADTTPWNAWAIDLRERNDIPAGARGFVRAEGERLIYADGTEARFWGTNVQAYALFHRDKRDIALQAQRIAALGYNLVRIHHHDSAWVDPNIFGSGDDRRSAIDPEHLDTIHWWTAKLREQGVAVWLDLHVGRTFHATDAIPGFADLTSQRGEGKGFVYVNDRLASLLDEFATAYLTTPNPYTGLAYVDDPAVVGVLITNENDLTTHFGNAMLADKNVPTHHRLFRDRIREIARASGLDRRDAMRTWEPGASKLAMNELERRFFDERIAHLRSIGVRVPIATTNFWGGMGLHGLASLTRGDVIDVHSYGEPGELEINPAADANWIHRIACAQVEGMPVTVSEWNVPYPSRDRFTAPLWAAAAGSVHGWDAMMHYGYCQRPVSEPFNAGAWSSWIDPAITTLMPAASVMFRDRHLEANNAVVYAPTREELYFADSTPDAMPALRTLTETGALSVRLPDTPELAWDSPRGTADGVRTDEVDRLRGASVSASGITRDWAAGTLTIDAPMSQAVSGWIGGRAISTDDATFEIQTPAATVALTALDGRPIRSSSRVLVTAVAQAVAPDDRAPFYAEPVTGQVSVALDPGVITLTALLPDGRRGAPAGLDIDDGRALIELTGTTPTHWFVLERGESPPGTGR